MSLICVSIPVESPPSALDDAAAARSAGADLVEFRVDGFFSGSSDPVEFRRVVGMVTESPLPCIVTCRPVAEGGHYDGDDSARVALFEALGTAAGGAGSLPPRFLDVELATYLRSANLKQKVNLAVGHPGQVRDLATSLILSSHDFTGRPPDLSRRLLAMADEPAAAVIKIAYRARSIRDNLELFDLLSENAGGKPMIALAMGEFGLMSRVLAPKFGGFLTFASLRPEGATAPGQPTIDELLNLYRFRSIGPRTRVYGVVGWPVAGSLSPAMHNAAFARAGIDAVYLPLPVPDAYEHFKATLHALLDHPRLDFSGCSVTMPHKQHLVRFAREEIARAEIPWTIDRLSQVCGAANTLAVERDATGKPVVCRIFNTDGPAAVECVQQALGRPLAGVAVAILGAGGLARAIAATAADAGAQVTIHGRDPAKSESLAAELGTALGDPRRIASDPVDRLLSARWDVVVNCTPVGMAGGTDPDRSPIDPSALQSGPLVFDTVYRPRRTRLLDESEAAGLRTLDGLTLLSAQAGLQWEAWTGAKPPAGVMGNAAAGRVEPGRS